jgi:hypothetical protein
MKFTIQVEVSEDKSRLTLYPTAAMKEWTKRNKIHISEIAWPSSDDPSWFSIFQFQDFKAND